MKIDKNYFNVECFECSDVHPADFMEIAHAVITYIKHDWNEREFKHVFPAKKDQYMWDERGENFIDFYLCLDYENRQILMNRIMTKRYLYLDYTNQ